MQTPAQINAQFDGISYDKGGSILYMMRTFLGNSTYNAGISRYLHRHEYNNTVTKDLWAAMDAEVQAQGATLPSSVDDIMSRFTDQPGYPVVHITGGPTGSSLAVSQVGTLMLMHKPPSLPSCAPLPLFLLSRPDFSVCHPLTATAVPAPPRCVCCTPPMHQSVFQHPRSCSSPSAASSPFLTPLLTPSRPVLDNSTHTAD